MESSIVREAEVYWNEELAGTIEQTPRESTFRYRPGFGPTPLPGGGIALHLPLGAGRFATLGTLQHTFFANLLPEGFRLNALRSRMRASADDALSMLLRVGADCVGNVSVVPAGERPAVRQPEFRAEDAADLDLLELLTRDLDAKESIPGVQEKLSDQMVSFPAKVGSRAAIVKLSPPSFPFLASNEHFFMRMAAACGLTVAETRLVVDRTGSQALLVRRFDRTTSGKLHQEDACQLLDIYPGAKYSVSIRDIAQAVTRFGSGGPVQLRRLLELVAFSYLIGNGDLHAKNVSLYRSERGLLEVTPAYDLLSTLPYPALDQRMALKLDGKDANLRRPFICGAFGSLGLPEKATNAILDRICDSSLPWVDRLAEIGFDNRTNSKLRREILRRREHLGGSRQSVKS